MNIAQGYLWKFLGIRKGEPFRPFPKQYELISSIPIPWPGFIRDPATGLSVPSPSIFGVNCGRRFSKTTSAEVLAWQAFLAPDDLFGPPTVRITADTFEHGLKIWDRFVFHMENTELGALIKSYNRGRFLIEGMHGATIQLLSADNPQTLAGDGVTCWLIDEAQYLSYAAYENLLPSTAERDGVIVMFGVAEGEGPFREVCFKGDRPREYPEFKRLHYPTSDNPFVPRHRIEMAKRMYTPSRFKQLYEAEWDTDTGKIIKNVRGCIVPGTPVVHTGGWAEVSPPRPGHVYYGGLDLALHSDWCVYTIADRYGNLVAYDRFNRGSWELLKARVRRLHDYYYRPLTWVDSTGSGDPIFDDLQRRGMNVEGFQISTNARKRMLVDELAIRIGAGNLHYPEVRLMIAELENFESKVTGAGIITYSAPAGLHDDFVMSLALLCHGLPRPLAPAFAEQLERGMPDVRQYSEADEVEDRLDQLTEQLPVLNLDEQRQKSAADY